MADVLAVMSTGNLMMDAKDAASCNFGKWLKNQSINNSKVKEVLSKATAVHEKFHQTGSAINTFIMKGKQFEAVTAFNNEMWAAADEIFGHLDALRTEASQAEEIYAKMNHQAMGPCVEKQRIALGLLGKVVKINEDIAVPRTRIPELIGAIRLLAETYRLLIVSFRHAGDGNIHVDERVVGSAVISHGHGRLLGDAYFFDYPSGASGWMVKGFKRMRRPQTCDLTVSV